MNANLATPEAATAQVVTKLSPWSVTDTVARLCAIVAAKGLKLFAVIDHSGEAEAVGLQLHQGRHLREPGSRDAGHAGLAACGPRPTPEGAGVLEGHQTRLSYTAPRALAARYELSEELGDRLGGIDAITDAVLGRHESKSD